MPERPCITVLHIDDTEANRYVVSRMLRKAEFNILEAASGQEGLEIIEKLKPDLIILDVKIPDINGFEICRLVKSNPATATIPILFLSANYVKIEDKAYGLDSGADAYLIQPVESVELIATVKALWRMRQAEDCAFTLAHQWQTTFDAMNDGVCILNEEGRVIRCNNSMKAIVSQLGSELSECSNEEFIENFLVNLDTNLFPFVRKTLQRQSQEIQSKESWFSISLDPILNKEGIFNGAVYIMTDITNRKRLEEERIQLLAWEQAARAEAETANRLKDEFLATLSHELRTPLNAILGWSRLLNTNKFDAATTTKAIATIEKSAKAQAQLVEHLLDISQIIRGQLRLDVRPVELVMVIEAALDTVGLAAEAKQIHIETILDYGVGLVSGDADRLQQVFWNLLSNAVKFTPKGGRIQVRLEQIEPCCVQVVVRDTGKGISPDFLPYVFERFRQADGSITRSYGGLGLGLAIVRQLVELHGGTVKAESAGENQGATFTVKLPVMGNGEWGMGNGE